MFKFNGKIIFLTYKNHVTINLLKKLLQKFSGSSTYKICHEVGKTGYKHSHILICFNKKQHTTKQDKFDIDGIHPNIKCVRSKEHFSNILKYMEKDIVIKDTLTGNEYEWLGSVRDIIQSKRSWRAVLNDDYLTPYIQKYGKWAKEVFDCKPRPKMFKHEQLMNWQQHIYDKFINDNSDRNIYWVYDDKNGDNGKTALGHYILDKHGEDVFYSNGGKTTDVAHSYDFEPIVIFNLVKEKQEYLSYGIMEMMKDRIITSGKYNSTTKYLENSPKIIVFANWKPDEKKIVGTRFVKYIIKNKQIVPEVLNIKMGLPKFKNMSTPEMISLPEVPSFTYNDEDDYMSDECYNEYDNYLEYDHINTCEYGVELKRDSVT